MFRKITLFSSRIKLPYKMRCNDSNNFLWRAIILSIRHMFRLPDISGNTFRAYKKEKWAFWWLFFSIIAYKGGENPARVFRQKIAINLYRDVAYQGKCFDRARGCRLSYHEARIPYPLHNNTRDDITADCSHYPPTVIRIQTITEVATVFALYDTNNIKWHRIALRRGDRLPLFSLSLSFLWIIQTLSCLMDPK